MKKELFRKHPTDFQEIDKYLSGAGKNLVDARKILRISEEVAFKTTYDAMMKITLALMMSTGLRPRTQVGHHIAMIRFARQTLGREYKRLIDRYDWMRQKRHLLVYGASWTTQKEAKEAIGLAEKYLETVRVFIQKRKPQKELL